MFNKKNYIKKIGFKEALTTNYNNIYAQNGKGHLLLAWRQKNIIGWIMYYLFSPFYLWQHARISSVIIIFFWVVLLNELTVPECRQGAYCNYSSMCIYAVLILLFSARPKTKITKSSLKLNNQVLFDGENIIVSNEEIQRKIMLTGLAKFLEQQERKIQLDIKEENEKKIKEENIKLENEKHSLISLIDKKYESSIKNKKQTFEVVSSINWGIDPKKVTFIWKVSDVALLSIKEKVQYCVKIDQLNDLKEKIGLFRDRDYGVLDHKPSIKIKFDDLEMGIIDIVFINADTRKVVTREADEKVSYVTRTAGMDNIFDTKFKAHISKTEKKVKKIEEVSHIRVTVKVTLINNKNLTLQSDYYTDSYKDLFKLIDYINNNKQS